MLSLQNMRQTMIDSGTGKMHYNNSRTDSKVTQKNVASIELRNVIDLYREIKS